MGRMWLAACLVILVVLAGCSSPPPTPTPTPFQARSVPTPTATPTATLPSPTFTATSRPQRLDVAMPPGSVSRATVVLAKGLKAGEQVEGFANLVSGQYGADWSHEWSFQAFGPDGEQVANWTGRGTGKRTGTRTGNTHSVLSPTTTGTTRSA